MGPLLTARPAVRDERSWLTDPVESGSAAGFGVYLHVPFCHHRCGYCDFAVAAVGGLDGARRDDLERRYVAALTTDLARQVAAGPGAHAPPARHHLDGGSAGEGSSGEGSRGERFRADRPEAQPDDRWPLVTSIFVGGGTPTLLPPSLLAEAITAVGRELDLAASVEVTVEANPETASEELFATLAEVGVTRVSIGAQSFAPHVLTTLERGHDADAPVVAAELARAAGIDDISLDLIYGTPGETDADWEESLARVLGAGVDHVSAYALTIHEGTPFGRRVARGQLPMVDEDVQATRFEALHRLLGGAGFDHYEVSNLARGAGRRSRHNLLYWRHGDYLGVGAGAHGHLAGRRWWSTRSAPRYVHAIESEGARPPGAVGGVAPGGIAGGLVSGALAGSEVLDDAQRAAERLFLGLRVREGIHPNDLPPIDPLALEDALDAGLVETACGRLRCTEAGWFLLDEAVDRLTA